MSQRVLGNIFIRENTIDPGGSVDGHTHNFDHVTVCFAGRIRVAGDDPYTAQHYETVLDAGSMCLIRSDINHTLTQEAGTPPLVASALADMKARLLAAIPGASDAIEAAFDQATEAASNVPARYGCIYSHRTPQGDVVLDYDSGWPGAYAARYPA